MSRRDFGIRVSREDAARAIFGKVRYDREETNGRIALPPKVSLPRVAWLEKRLPFWDDPEPRRRRRRRRPGGPPR